ncbi:Gluconate transport-inducing protein [Lecanora helva]
MEQVRYQRSPDAADVRPKLDAHSSRGNPSNIPRLTSSLEQAQASATATSNPQNLPRLSEMETYNGHVRTPADAIVLFEACRLGLLPRVQRRLSEKERQSIKSGSVFVWDEREAGMRRWTDGKSWSASRVSGSFLTYREMEGKRGGNNFGPPLAAVSRAGKTPDSTRGSDSDAEMAGEDGPDGYRYKPDGLMKQSFSITTSSGNHLHLISYYSRSHPAASNLNSPTSDPQLRHIRPQKGMYPESTVHEHQNIPAVTRSPMISAPYSTVPHMAGYARQGPQQWSPQYNGYGWPPPPMQQPQAPQCNYQYGAGHYVGGPPPPPPPPLTNGNYQNAPPPPTNGHSPLSQAHSVSQHPPPQPQDVQHTRFPPISGPPAPYAYDARNGPPTTPQPNHYTDDYRQPPDQNAPPVDPRYSSSQYRSPPSHPDNLNPVAQHQNRNAHFANGVQHPQYQQQQYQAQNHTASPHQAQIAPRGQPQYSQNSAHLSTPIDPRLFGPSPMMPQELQMKTDSRTSTPATATQENLDSLPSHTNGVSQASIIPSIGSIMNGSSAEDNNSPNADARSDKSGDRTPGGSAKKESRPQDIPSDKLGFGEDMRALKVLDRAFKT